MIERIILVIIAATLFSCDDARKLKKPYVITSKAYSAYAGLPKLPPCICYYRFNIDHRFQDSCGKYEIGDTIK
jgi:hypothetical protein